MEIAAASGLPTLLLLPEGRRAVMRGAIMTITTVYHCLLLSNQIFKPE